MHAFHTQCEMDCWKRNANLLIWLIVSCYTSCIPESIEAHSTSRCPDEWELHEDWCYFPCRFCHVSNYNEAKTSCLEMGSNLTSIHSSDEQAFVTKLAEDHQLWIGLNDIESEGTFTWVDETQYDYEDWNKPAPRNCSTDNLGCTSDCVHMNYDGGWTDYYCDFEGIEGYICKKEALPQKPTVQMTSVTHFSKPPTMATNLWTPETTEYFEPSTTQGLIIGIVLGILLLFGCVIMVIVIILYYRKRKSLKYPMERRATQHAYDGPYDLTIDGNDSAIIKKNGTIKYDQIPFKGAPKVSSVSYQNLSASTDKYSESLPAKDSKHGVDNEYAYALVDTDQQDSSYQEISTENGSHYQNEVVGVYSNPDDPEYSETDKTKAEDHHLDEGPPSTKSSIKSKDDENAGWEDNVLYSASRDTESEAGINADDQSDHNPSQRNNTEQEQGKNPDSSPYAMIDDPQYSEVSETKHQYDGAPSLTTAAATYDDDEEEGWEDNSLYGKPQGPTESDGDPDEEGWMDNNIYVVSNKE